MRKKVRVSPSTRNLVKLLRRHFSNLRAVEFIYLRKVDGVIAVNIISGKLWSRQLKKAYDARWRAVKLARRDLRISFRIFWRGMPSRRMPTPSGAITAYRRPPG